jgi:type I restriction enzyme S subunit
MASRRSRRLGDVIMLDRQPIDIDPNDLYTSIGIRSFGRGLFHYPVVPGAELSRLRFYKFPAGALAISNIKAWEGAVALTTEEDCQSIASNRFLFYVAKGDEVDIEYLYYYFLTDAGISQLGRSSPGSADRNRTLSIRGFENITVELPDRTRQEAVCERLRADFSIVDQLEKAVARQKDLLEGIRRRALSTALDMA